MSTHFITFGAGIFDSYVHDKPANFYEAGKRLINEAKNLQVFDNTQLYSDDDLKDDDIFWSQHKDFITNNKRGYGYWIWKSYIIKKTMSNMKDGDILLYADSGCTLRENKKYMQELFQTVEKDKIIGSLTSYSDVQYTKQDLINHLGMENSEKINTKQRQATAIMFYVCDKTRNFVDLWYDTCCIYHMIDDSKSIEKKHVSYCAHRHDQSVFSLLTKLHNIYSETTLLGAVLLSKKRTG
tara:strand:- start:2551 stop:3267 length:717 start_codon:yes stop_codon:yes gene_type:complete